MTATRIGADGSVFASRVHGESAFIGEVHKCAGGWRLDLDNEPAQFRTRHEAVTYLLAHWGER